ncbi:hypothetical protein [Streptomyces gardneri]|uniref:hypothetical protein n=1 Tax=Streptomyces gardneri TaxID=66892 RepID=UPI0036BC83C3
MIRARNDRLTDGVPSRQHTLLWALRYNSAKQANPFVNWNSRECLAVLDGNKNDGAAVIRRAHARAPDPQDPGHRRRTGRAESSPR